MKSYRNADLALLLIRLGLAAIFLFHGIAKAIDLSGTAQFFSVIGLNAPIAYLVIVIETLGGLAMFLGVWPRVAGIALAITMLGAMITVKFAKGFGGGWEFDLILFLAALAVALAGPGKYAIGKKKLG
ncbi:MAG: DoxX family protein [Candidatus Liptonbacteria bacterium]|nr:DoxX family protein [Candidatus Liptonbacteria bacterium]